MQLSTERRIYNPAILGITIDEPLELPTMSAYNRLPLGDERKLRALVHILDYFEDHAPQVPASMIEAFLLVAMNEGCSLRDVVEMSGKPQSTMSRHLLDLGERNRRMEPGLNLIGWRHSPMELRRKEYYLTPKGKGLLRRVLSEEFVDTGKLGGGGGGGERNAPNGSTPTDADDGGSVREQAGA